MSIKEKIEIRKNILNQLKNLTPEEWDKRSRSIINNFLSLPEYKTCWTLMSYVSFNKEVDTIPIIKDALGKAKTVCVPEVKWEDSTMKPVQIFNLDDIDFSTKVPQPLSDAKIIPAEIDLIITPGLAFDRGFNRLGRGKGFYDRFLRVCNGIKVSLSFDFQVFESIPVDEKDVPIDIIITETEILRH